jgi:Glycine cleavage system H protein (lipoate-binding)
LTSRFARKNSQPPWKRNRSTENQHHDDPRRFAYTESHEWIKREGENIRVGITDHAQSELTDVVYVELPKLERQVNAKEPIASSNQ